MRWGSYIAAKEMLWNIYTFDHRLAILSLVIAVWEWE